MYSNISGKMLEDVIKMYDNISKIKKVCGEIVSRNIVKIIDNEESTELLSNYGYISKTEREAEKMKEDMIEINGGVKGYSTNIYLEYINIYDAVVRMDMKCKDMYESIREKYI